MKEVFLDVMLGLAGILFGYALGALTRAIHQFRKRRHKRETLTPDAPRPAP